MSISIKKFAIIPALLICLSGCKSVSAIDVENSPASGLSFSSDDIVQSEAAPENNPTSSSEARNLKAVDFSSEQSALKDYIKFARSKINSVFLEGDECAITLRNVYGNEKPEMIIAIKENQSPVNHEHYFTTDENDEPIYLGYFYHAHDAIYSDTEFGLYMDSLNTYYITCGSHPPKDNIYWMCIEKLELPIEGNVSPDFSEYQNSDALDFINNTHMYFMQYDN